MPTALLQDPVAVFCWLATLVALIFWLSELSALRGWFKYVPPLVHCYFVPTISSTIGITPLASPAYDLMRLLLLPIALFLLMVTVDLPAIAKVGRTALVVMLAGTLGIMIGGPVAFAVFQSWLPPDAWKGLAALSGSWIGGSANFVAIAESVGAPDAILGPAIVVDTVVAYSWMAVLLALSAWQERFDRKTGARREALDEASDHLAALALESRPTGTRDLLLILGLALGTAGASIAVGRALPDLGSPTIISHSTWTVLAAVTVGLALSFTPIRRLEATGASSMGYVALYLLITAIGAQADVRAILAAPAFLATGVLWMAIHVVILLLAVRLLRAPLFFFAVSSMANVGGAASAPLVAAAYHPSMAPVGLLLAILGYILGIYGGLATAWMLGQIAGG